MAHAETGATVVRGRFARLSPVCAAALACVLTGTFVLVTSDARAVEPGASTSSHGGSGVHTLYLVRHGFYDETDDRDPEVGKGLRPLGIAQARLVAARLRALGVEMSSLHSSTMTRAYQTALVMQEDFPDLEIEPTRALCECTPTTWRADIMADEDPEDVAACERQLEAAFAEFFIPTPAADRHDILVCHGNVIRYFVTKVLEVDTAAWLGMSLGNCSLTTVRIHPDGSMKLLGFGDVGHIPPNLQSGMFEPARPLEVPPAKHR